MHFCVAFFGMHEAMNVYDGGVARQYLRSRGVFKTRGLALRISCSGLSFSDLVLCFMT